jgi:micrococcal nuclease
LAICALATYDESPIDISLKECVQEECNCVLQAQSENGVLGNERVFYDVVDIVDGDTVKVRLDGVTETIRMIGVNTPETVDPRRPVECFGKEASQKAQELLEGKRVALEADVTQGDRDKYNRLLRFVFLEDGTNFGERMIREGYAYEYTYKKPYVYQELYREAQTFAQEHKNGLWADSVCTQ